eukprot:3844589-Amphidinium_carterae.1
MADSVLSLEDPSRGTKRLKRASTVLCNFTLLRSQRKLLLNWHQLLGTDEAYEMFIRATLVHMASEEPLGVPIGGCIRHAGPVIFASFAMRATLGGTPNRLTCARQTILLHPDAKDVVVPDRLAGAHFSPHHKS